MAVTYLTEEQRKQQQAMQPQQAQQPAQAYSGMRGVTQNTAQNVGRYQNGYRESERVQNARNLLEQNNAAKPQGYNSKYGEQLEQILQKITNPEGFKYSFAGDALFNSARDIAVQSGKQAAMDVAGQAAALTGGYGNSYGTAAGAQAYQQSLMNLNAQMPEYYDRAYGAYRDRQGDMKDAYSILSSQEQKDYDRFRDQYGDWLNERDYLTARADMERSLDRGEFESERDYWTALAAQENKDYWQNEEFQENKRQYDTNFNEQQRQFNAEIEEKQRQFNESLNWDKMSTEQKYAAEYCMQILAAGGMPTDELLRQAGLSAEDAAKLMAQPAVAAGGGGGGGGGGTPAAPSTPKSTGSSKPKSLLGAIDGATVAMQKQQTPEKVTPAGPINTNINVPAAQAPQKQTVEQILKNGITDVYKLRTKK